MSKQSDKFSFKKWLEQSMHEGWQLELIISSILLVVLSGTDKIFSEWMTDIMGPGDRGGYILSILVMIVIMLEIAVSVAKLNLIIHIFLRGLWIGCIGLRNISKEIDFKSLSYAPKFNNYLEKNVIDFDTYLERLEKNCSTIFSFTFLIIFEVFSMFMFIICLLGIMVIKNFIINNVFGNSEGVEDVVNFIALSITVILLISALLHLIDFIFIGIFKKNKILAKIYYPFYRLYNFFSFSFLYRSLYYNFIDNGYGRTYVKMIIPYLIIIAIADVGINIGGFKYMPEYAEENNWLPMGYYDDTRNPDGRMAIGLNVSIPSMQMKENFLPIFLRQTYEDSRALKEICPDFSVYEQSEISLGISVDISTGGEKQKKNRGEYIEKTANKMKADSALVCVSQLYEVQIDSVLFDNSDYLFHIHPDLKWRGIITYLDIEQFSRGMHTLQVTKIIDYQDSSFVKRTFEIPFVKY